MHIKSGQQAFPPGAPVQGHQAHPVHEHSGNNPVGSRGAFNLLKDMMPGNGTKKKLLA